MSYKDQRKELGLAGSNAPLTSTQDGSKWHHGVDGAGIARLTKISTEINQQFEEGAKEFAKLQIKLGRLLNDARALIPGDRQFGQWREQYTPITNKSTANKLMNLAKQVGEGRITQQMIDELPISTLKELISAPDHVVTHVRDRLREEDAPAVTRQEIRELTQQEKDEEDEPALSPADGVNVNPPAPKDARPTTPPKAPPAPGQAPRVHLNDVAESIINMTLVDRLRHLDSKGKPPYDGCKPQEWAWLVFGLDPIPAYNPNWLAVESLAKQYDILVQDAPDAENLVEILNKAFGIIEAQY